MNVFLRLANVIALLLVAALLLGNASGWAMGTYHGAVAHQAHADVTSVSADQPHALVHQDGEEPPADHTDRCGVPGCFLSAMIQLSSGVTTPLSVAVPEIVVADRMPAGQSVKPDRPPVIS